MPTARVATYRQGENGAQSDWTVHLAVDRLRPKAGHRGRWPTGNLSWSCRGRDRGRGSVSRRGDRGLQVLEAEIELILAQPLRLPPEVIAPKLAQHVQQ